MKRLLVASVLASVSMWLTQAHGAVQQSAQAEQMAEDPNLQRPKLDLGLMPLMSVRRFRSYACVDCPITEYQKVKALTPGVFVSVGYRKESLLLAAYVEYAWSTRLEQASFGALLRFALSEKPAPYIPMLEPRVFGTSITVRVDPSVAATTSTISESFAGVGTGINVVFPIKCRNWTDLHMIQLVLSAEAALPTSEHDRSGGSAVNAVAWAATVGLRFNLSTDLIALK